MEGTSTFTSAAVVSGHDDLLLEILLRLPAKSLIRFKSVCKHWSSVISDASFRHLHTRRHRNPETSFLLCVCKSQFFHFNPTSKNFVPSNLNFDRVKILQSCKGLLVLQRGYRHNQDKDYYVLNPTTGESRNLLVPNVKGIRCLFLAFDPLKSPYYKVFCLASVTCSSPLYEIEVYDSETHQWHHHNTHCNVMGSFSQPRECVYLDLNNSIYSTTDNCRIVCFDIENLVFGTPSLDAEPQRSAFCITESFGHVHYISYNEATKRYVLYEMTEKNGQLLFDFDTSVTTLRKPFFFGVIGGERKEEQSMVFQIRGKIMAYRFHEKSFEKLLDLSTQRFYKNGHLLLFSEYCQFVESLTPV